jgi:hypothetical protein
MADNSEKLITDYINSISDWRGKILSELRAEIHTADPEIKEEWKWDVPVFTRNGMVCAISAFKDHVKINFFKGVLINDSKKLFNNGFTSKQHRSIDFSENDKIDKSALRDLIQQASGLNKK